MSGPSPRRRAVFRRNLYLLLGGIALGVLAALMRPHAARLPILAVQGEPAVAPAEPALRPNEPSEPVLGTRTPSPGEED